MIFNAIEAELHLDSIFNIENPYFMGFRPDFDQISDFDFEDVLLIL